MARLILCADDFGISHGTSATIADLAAAGQINAISCMTASAGWSVDAKLLRKLPPTIDVGLHLVLTTEPGLVVDGTTSLAGALTIDRSSLLSLAGRLSLDTIGTAIDRQFRAFVDAMSRPPAFVDGHQHAHMLPGIRDIMLSATAHHAPGAWVRNCADRPLAMAQRHYRAKAFASAIWSMGLRRDAARYTLATNDSFAGHYDFATDFKTLFPTFLRAPGDRHLVMCHPGSEEGLSDAIGPARVREAAALRSLSIGALAKAAGLGFGPDPCVPQPDVRQTPLSSRQ